MRTQILFREVQLKVCLIRGCFCAQATLHVELVQDSSAREAEYKGLSDKLFGAKRGEFGPISNKNDHNLAYQSH